MFKMENMLLSWPIAVLPINYTFCLNIDFRGHIDLGTIPFTVTKAKIERNGIKVNSWY